jgi:DNA-binding response OmpR family regulator
MSDMRSRRDAHGRDPEPRRLVLATNDSGGLVLERALQANGWETTRQGDARVLVAHVARGMYDVALVVLDGNGIESMELLIRLSSLPRRTPVVLLTHRTRANSFSVSALAALGVQRLVAWPCRIDPILAALEEACAAAPASTTRPEQLVS